MKTFATTTQFAVILTSLVSAGLVAAQTTDPESNAPGAENADVRWRNGPASNPGYFPIGVWAQHHRDAGNYSKLGVNLYLSLPGGPTEEQLTALKRAGMKTICRQNNVGLSHIDDPTIIGWMHGDEPDNFTKDGAGKWVPKRTSKSIVADYERIMQNDPSRPVLLNLGQGVSNDQWKGGWAKESDYRELVKGCDIVSYDIYPACSTREEVTGKLELCAKGVSRLRQWSQDEKVVWFITEAAHIQNPARMATPHQMRFEVWSSIIHGARGIIYFCHQWKPTRDFAAPLNNAVTRKAVTSINRQIAELAPVLNSASIDHNSVTVVSTNDDTQIATMQKHDDEVVFVFAAAMGDTETTASFKLAESQGTATARVIGEDRTIDVEAGRFKDNFQGYDVHIYRIELVDSCSCLH
jgi:hypothetical protein